jgi:hypothetical protein
MIQGYPSWVYPKELSQRTIDSCTPMCIAALFTIASYGISLGAHQQMNG